MKDQVKKKNNKERNKENKESEKVYNVQYRRSLLIILERGKESILMWLLDSSEISHIMDNNFNVLSTKLILNLRI